MIIDNDSTFHAFVKKSVKSLGLIDENVIIAGGYISYLYRLFYFENTKEYEGDIDCFGRKDFEVGNISGMKVDFISKKGKERFCFIDDFDINSIMIGYDKLTDTLFYNNHFVEYTQSREIKIINSDKGIIRSIIRAWVKSHRDEGEYKEFQKDLKSISLNDSSYPLKGVEKKWKVFKKYNNCFKESFNYIIKNN